MLKDKLATVLVILTLALALAPAASQAAPLGLSHSGGAAGLLEQVAQWWDRLADHAFGWAPASRVTHFAKNGCGIDPNGKPIPCPGEGPDPGTQATTPPGGGDPGR